MPLTTATLSPVRGRANSIDALRAILWPQLERFDLITFDVFDTLLGRRIHPPDWVQRRICRELARRCGLRDDLYPVRKRLERELGATRATAGEDAECTLEEVLAALVDHCVAFSRTGRAATAPGQSADLVASLVRLELQLEREVTYPLGGMCGLVEELRKAGKRVALVSDMYLSANQIRGLLEHHSVGIEGLPIYVSSEHRASKASGRLFRRVLARERLAAVGVLHVGDQRHSDFVMPLSLGLSAVWWRDRENSRRQRRVACLLDSSTRNERWNGPCLMELCRPRAAKLAADQFYDYGREMLGLPFAVFSHRLIERSRELGLQQLIFVAREGFLFQQTYEKLAARLVMQEPQPSTSYACLSRQSTALECTEDSRREAREAVEDSSPSPRALLAEYLDACGFFGTGRRVGLVDVGWRGSIESQLRRTYAARPNFPELHGLYFGHRADEVPGRAGSLDAAHESAVGEGLIYDYRRDGVALRAVVECLPLWEETARAPHGTTLGYRRDETGRVLPVLAGDDHPGRREEQLAEPKLALLQRGVLDFAEEYARAVALLGFTAESLLPYLAVHITRMICLPRRHEAQSLLGLLRHAPDEQAEAARSLGFEGFSAWRPRDWRRLLQRSRTPHWRQATLATAHPALSWSFTLAKWLQRRAA
ncbi:MAG: hypothetical protein ACOY3P_03080 [Planctomycetota bacterium]